MDQSSKIPPLEVGVIIKPHGLRGAVKVHLFNKESTALQDCEQITLCIGDEQRVIKVHFLGVSGADQILQIEGVKDCDAAEALRGGRLLIDRTRLEPLEEGQYYYVDLVGCQVFDEENNLLGKVHEVFSAGESEVMVVQGEEGERLIPLSEQWVISVDTQSQRVVVDGGAQWEPQK